MKQLRPTMGTECTKYISTCLAFVKTPLQLINATEYIFENKMSGSVLVVVCDIRKYTTEFYKNLIPLDLWSEVVFFETSNVLPNGPLFKWINLIVELCDDVRFKLFFRSIVGPAPCFRELLVGNPRELWFRYATAKIPAGIVVDTEDGAASVNSNYIPSRSWILRNILFGFSRGYRSPTRLFTASNSLSFGSVGVKKNSYRYLKSVFGVQKRRNSNEIWFVGQPLVELGLMSVSSYIKILSEVAGERVDAVTVKYFPHPAEDLRKVQAICDETGLSRIERTQPLEIFLLGSEVLPARLAFIYSSAILTTKQLFGNGLELLMYVPPYGFFESKMRRDVYDEVFSTMAGEINGFGSVIYVRDEI